MVSALLRRCVDVPAEKMCVCLHSPVRWRLFTHLIIQETKTTPGCSSAQEGPGPGLCSIACSTNQDLQRHLLEETKG
ncbi:hypothetical protein PBY51_015337 [Eleginops maclovinus]|uniref:Uncharacterized protein n=1 Tax=Eleginops maclovinus TaxID=56733 RepID=A0AAN7WY44_ELEMC|nr:hypothetical protein PBY51_015337 [Eleginops maclovinus]